MAGEVIVDGVAYRYWDEDDPRSGSLSMANRGLYYPPQMFVEGPGVSVSFDYEAPGLDHRLWWRPWSAEATIAERVVRIAKSGRTVTSAEAMCGSPTVEEYLATATAALGRDVRAFVQAILGVGCDHRDRREAIDDWVATRAADLVAATPWLNDVTRHETPPAFSRRSALEFLVEMTSRLNVELELRLDAFELDQAPQPARPWGIPASHVWWTGGAANGR